MLNKTNIEKSLILLGERLEIDEFEPIEIIVCGGSALIVMNLIKRETTKDVDMVGFLKKDSKGKYIVEECLVIPATMKKAINQIAKDLGLEENWLNADPTRLLKFGGLPDGLIGRLQAKKYGKVLTVHFISRIDQIYFKLYAAADSGPGRHVDDLIDLKPTDDELFNASNWAMMQDNSEGFKKILKDMLEKLGYGKITERI